jgi:hypothetical protein
MAHGWPKFGWFTRRPSDAAMQRDKASVSRRNRASTRSLPISTTSLTRDSNQPRPAIAHGVGPRPPQAADRLVALIRHMHRGQFAGVVQAGQLYRIAPVVFNWSPRFLGMSEGAPPCSRCPRGLGAGTTRNRTARPRRSLAESRLRPGACPAPAPARSLPIYTREFAMRQLLHPWFELRLLMVRLFGLRHFMSSISACLNRRFPCKLRQLMVTSDDSESSP